MDRRAAGLLVALTASGCAETAPSGSGPLEAPSATTYVNPVLDATAADFWGHPDPAVLKVGSRYFMARTSEEEPDALPIYVSDDLVRWTRAGAVFPAGRWPTWASGDFWAPALHAIGGRVYVFFTARDRDPARNQQASVGVAWVTDLDAWQAGAEAFRVIDRPVVNDPSQGSIDPAYYRGRDGKDYLFFNQDLWVGPRHLGQIYVQELAITPDDVRPVGPRTTVVPNEPATHPWEGDIVEGAFPLEHDGQLYLLYGANRFWEGKYVVGVARAPAIDAPTRGPYEKRALPILVSSEAWKGPGHGTALRVDDAWYFLYHAYRRGAVGDGHPRLVLLDRMTWHDGWPLVNDGTPSATPRPAP
jgi:beta-xylosidase